MGKFHGETTLPFGGTAQLGHVAKHLQQWNCGMNDILSRS